MGAMYLTKLQIAELAKLAEKAAVGVQVTTDDAAYTDASFVAVLADMRTMAFQTVTATGATAGVLT